METKQIEGPAIEQLAQNDGFSLHVDYIKELLVPVIVFAEKVKDGLVYRLKAYPVAVWSLAKRVFKFLRGSVKTFWWAFWNGSTRPIILKVNGKVDKQVLLGRSVFLGLYLLGRVPVVLVRRKRLGQLFLASVLIEGLLWGINKFVIQTEFWVMLAGLALAGIPAGIAGVIAGYQWRHYRGFKRVVKVYLGRDIKPASLPPQAASEEDGMGRPGGQYRKDE